MKLIRLLPLLAVLAATSCQKRTETPSGILWHPGNFESALSKAASDKTLVMADFYTDW